MGFVNTPDSAGTLSLMQKELTVSYNISSNYILCPVASYIQLSQMQYFPVGDNSPYLKVTSIKCLLLHYFYGLPHILMKI